MHAMPWRQPLAIVLAVVVGGLCFVRLHGSGRSHASSDARVPHDTRFEGLRTQPAASDSAQLTAKAVSVAALRDAILASSLLTATPPAEPDPLAEARAELDARLAGAAPDPSRAGKLDRSLRPLLRPSILGETVAELVCGSALCRLTLIGEDEAHVNRAVTALSESLPKTFAGLAVYPETEGHRAVYVATTEHDLQVGERTPKGPSKRIE